MLVFEKDIKIPSSELCKFMCNFSNKINDKYIYGLLCKSKNNIVLYSFDNSGSEIDINNCPCSLIYYVDYNNDEINICIMFIATKYQVRNSGYASIFIEEFINFIKNKFINSNSKYNKINIVLDSIMEAVTFYEYIGFKWVTTDKYNKIFNITEDSESGYEHFIMVYQLL
jgi:hypothetical protein